MQRLKNTLTCLLFAIHAVFGCCIHHAHGFGVPGEPAVFAIYADHECGADNDGATHHSPGDHHAPRSCPQGACSFLKVESPQVNHDSGHALWIVATLPAVNPPTAATLAISHSTPIAADPFSAQLYLCYCALVI